MKTLIEKAEIIASEITNKIFEAKQNGRTITAAEALGKMRDEGLELSDSGEMSYKPIEQLPPDRQATRIAREITTMVGTEKNLSFADAATRLKAELETVSRRVAHQPVVHQPVAHHAPPQRPVTRIRPTNNIPLVAGAKATPISLSEQEALEKWEKHPKLRETFGKHFGAFNRYISRGLLSQFDLDRWSLSS